MSHQIKELFSVIAKFLTRAHCTPLKWDSSKQRLYQHHKPGMTNFEAKIKHHKQRLAILVGIHRISLLTLITQVTLTLRSGKASSASAVISVMASVVLSIYHSQLSLCQAHSAKFAAYVNALLDFGERMKDHESIRQRSFSEKVSIWFTQVMIPSTFLIPAGYVFGLHWLDPYDKPSLIGFWLLVENEGSWFIPVKVVVFLFNFWVWAVGVLVAIFNMICIQCLLTVSLRDCIHTFWNLEVNPGKISFSRRAQIYRQIQLIGSLQTEVQGEIMMTIFLVSIALSFSLNSVAMIHTPWSGENAGIILICSYMAFLCGVGALFLVGVQAGVWSDSKAMLEKLDSVNVARLGFMRRMESKMQKSFWKSCRNLIKVRFGVNNFVQKETPLNYMQYTISLTTQLLLLTY